MRELVEPSERNTELLIHRIAALCFAIVIAVSALTLVGWAAGNPNLGVFPPSSLPMAPLTAVALLLTAPVGILSLRRPVAPLTRSLAATNAVLVALAGANVLRQSIFSLPPALEHWLFAAFPLDEAAGRGFMSPLTAVCCVLSSIALIPLLLRRFTNRFMREMSSWLSFALAAFGATVLVSFGYGTPLLLSTGVIPMALPTALSFMMLGLGIFASNCPDMFLVTQFLGSSTRAILLRAFLPMVFLSIVLSDFAQLAAAREAWLNPAAVNALTTLISALLTSLLVFWIARRISRILDSARTSLRQAEQELVRLTTAIEQAEETIVITDAAGTITYVNPCFEKSTGYTRAEALGNNPRILKSGHQGEAFYRQMWQILSSGKVWRGQLRNKRKDGTEYLEEASISPVCDESGRIGSYIAVKLDVSREEQLRAQLHQAQKMESLGRLAAGVAHDFNNILTVINGSSQIAAASIPPGSPVHEELVAIEEAGNRAAALTRQLLAFSRTQTLLPRVLDLNRVVSDMQSLLGRLLGRSHHLLFTPGVGNPTVSADPSQIEQVIMNLVVNARDAMPGGGQLLLQTGVERKDRPGTAPEPGLPRCLFAVLSVSDTGTGMDDATRLRIFEPFFSTKGQDKGTGLGLSTVHGVVEQSGGFIEVDSAPGKGTTFRVFLPAAAERT